MIEVVNGDLLSSDAQFICHQVNCMGVMGSGVARQIREKFPKVYEEYKKVCDQYADHPEQLLGQICGVRFNNKVAIINLFGQFEYGRLKKSYTDLSALRKACEEVAANVHRGDKIAMPYRIGCGLANGDWGKVMDMLTDVFSEHHLTLYKL